MNPEYNAKVNGLKSQLPEAREKRKATWANIAKEKRYEIILMLVVTDYNLAAAYKKVYPNILSARALHVEASRALDNPDMRKEIVEFLSEVDKETLSLDENMNIEDLTRRIMRKEIKKRVPRKRVQKKKEKLSAEDEFYIRPRVYKNVSTWDDEN